MSYATQQDMIDRYAEAELIQLTDRNNTGAIDATVLGKALADANALIDGYLIGRYTLPLATVPVALTRYACDVARYLLHDNAATEEVRNRYEDAKRFLEMVSQGKITLGLDASQVATPTAGGPTAEANDRVFSQDTLEDY